MLWAPRVLLCPAACGAGDASRLSFVCLCVLFPDYWLMGCINCDSLFLRAAALVALLPSGLIKGQMPALRGFGSLKRRLSD